jgi:hypothetical protein
MALVRLDEFRGSDFNEDLVPVPKIVLVFSKSCCVLESCTIAVLEMPDWKSQDFFLEEALV